MKHQYESNEKVVETPFLVPYRVNHKWVVADKAKNIVPYGSFDDIQVFNPKVFIVKKGNLWGLLDITGKKLSAHLFTDFQIIDENYLFVECRGKHWGLINKEGNLVIPCQFDEIGKVKNNIAPVKQQGKWGFYALRKGLIVPCEFDYASEFSEGLAAVCINKQWSYINSEGKTVICGSYSNAQPFSNGLAAVCHDNLYGYINEMGEAVIPFIFQSAEPFSEGLAAILMEKKWGFINKQGTVIIPCRYKEVSYFKSGITITDKRWVIDKSGNVVGEYKYIEPFKNGWHLVVNYTDKEKLGTWRLGFINEVGNEIIPCRFKLISRSNFFGVTGSKNPFEYGYEILKDDEDKLLLIDKEGKAVSEINCHLPLALKGMQYLSEDVILVEAYGQSEEPESYYDDDFVEPTAYGIIDRHGAIKTPFKIFEQAFVEYGLVHFVEPKTYGLFHPSGLEILPCLYENILESSEGMIPVKRHSKWGFINVLGQTICETIYDTFKPFHRGLASVKQNGRWGIIDAKGNSLVNTVYEDAIVLSSQVCAIKQGGRFALIDVQNQTSTPFLYEAVDDLDNGSGIFYLQKDRKWGAINEWGETIVDFAYDQYFANVYGHCILCSNGKWGLINCFNQTAISFEYDSLEPINGELIKFGNGELFGVLDMYGQVVLEPKYKRIGTFSSGIMVAITDISYLLFTTRLEKIAEIDRTRFDTIDNFSENRAAVTKDMRSGYIDTTGEVVIPLTYIGASAFKDGYAIVTDEHYNDYTIDLYGHIKEMPSNNVIKTDKQHLFNPLEDHDFYYPGYGSKTLRIFYGSPEGRHNFFSEGTYFLYDELKNCLYQVSQKGDIIYHTKEKVKNVQALERFGDYFSNEKNDKRGTWDNHFRSIIPNVYENIYGRDDGLILVGQYLEYFIDARGNIYKE